MPSSRTLQLFLALICGTLAGVGGFTFVYGKGFSYLSDEPSVCANCHVMQEHFDAWQASSHASVATCNDCHVSKHPVGKWVTKADNGFFHSLAFTLGAFPDPIVIKARNRNVTQQRCLGCHKALVHALVDPHPDHPPRCARCHASVGHAHRPARGEYAR